jgi:hypothetical protein
MISADQPLPECRRQPEIEKSWARDGGFRNIGIIGKLRRNHALQVPAGSSPAAWTAPWQHWSRYRHGQDRAAARPPAARSRLRRPFPALLSSACTAFLILFFKVFEHIHCKSPDMAGNAALWRLLALDARLPLPIAIQVYGQTNAGAPRSHRCRSSRRCSRERLRASSRSAKSSIPGTRMLVPHCAGIGHES